MASTYIQILTLNLNWLTENNMQQKQICVCPWFPQFIECSNNTVLQVQLLLLLHRQGNRLRIDKSNYEFTQLHFPSNVAGMWRAVWLQNVCYALFSRKWYSWGKEKTFETELKKNRKHFHDTPLPFSTSDKILFVILFFLH